MHGQCEGPKRDDCKDSKAALNPEKFLIERRELRQVILPVQPVGNLKAGEEDDEVSGSSKPQGETEELVQRGLRHMARIACINGSATRTTKGG